MSWAAVAVGAVSLGTSIYKGIKAHHADKVAKREAAALRRPFYQVQPEYIENKNLAKEEASQGFTSAERQAIDQTRERGLTTSLSALKQTGGGPNDVARLNSVFNDSLTSEAAEDAKLHLDKINFYTAANKDLAGQKNIQWGVNEKEPFETKLAEIQSRRTAAQTNENNAYNEALGSLSAAGTGVNSYFKTSAAAAPAAKNLSPYSRTFGLADTGAGGFKDPAAGYNVLDPNAAAGVAAQPTPNFQVGMYNF